MTDDILKHMGQRKNNKNNHHKQEDIIRRIRQLYKEGKEDLLVEN